MPIFFNMTVEHSRICAETDAMCGLVNIEPTVSGRFRIAYPRADFWMKDLGATTWH